MSTKAKKSWYRMKAAAADQPAEILIYDDIGLWGVNALDFVKDLAKLGTQDVIVAISCYGGDVVEGVAIYNALRRHSGKVTTRVDSVACSMASVIFMAGEQRIMPGNTMLMTHKPWSVYVGNSDGVQQWTADMQKFNDIVSSAYRRGGDAITDEKLAELMTGDNWLTADTCMQLGLATEIIDPIKLAAKASPMSYKLNVPDNIRAQIADPDDDTQTADPTAPDDPPPAPDPQQPPAADPAALLRAAAKQIADAGLSANVASVILAHPDVTDEASVTAKISWAKSVTDMCRTAKLPHLADGMLAAALPLDAARERLFAAMQAAAGADIDPTPPDDSPPGGSQPKKINAFDIYKARAAARAAGGKHA
jgi:ATP-dependent protease ClpP protease subunit